MDLLKDKNILGHAVGKRRVICTLVVALAAFATCIATFAQEGRRSVHKRKRGETISRYFHKVLTAILALHGDYLLPPGPTTPLEISGKDGFDPYFKDCVGAIDGTHILVTVDVDTQAPCHDRKGKYFLVDVGYANVPGFLTPYWCICYHLKEFSKENPINTLEELFNHCHSSLRNVIEHTFGILKQCFPILRYATSYQIMTQTKIVLACCILHNFITIEDGIPPEVDIDEEDQREGIHVPILEIYGMTQHDREDWGKFRDEIAKRMWDDYRS